MSIDINDKSEKSDIADFWAKWREYQRSPEIGKLMDGYHEDFCQLVHGRDNDRYHSTVAHALHLVQAMEMAVRVSKAADIDKETALMMIFDWAFKSLHGVGDDVVVFDLMDDYLNHPTPISDGNMYKGNRDFKPDYTGFPTIDESI